MTIPRVSVLIPVFNGARFLREALDSVLSQTFSDIEVLAVDDGSTDESLTILMEYAKYDSRVCVIRKTHSGFSETLNEGLRWARGAFVARIDADDMMMPNRIASQFDYLSANNDLTFCSSAVSLIDQEGRTFGRSQLPPTTRAELQDMIKRRVSFSFTHPAVMFRRDAVVAVGGYNGDYFPVEDLELFCRLILRGMSGLVVPEVLTAYRVHGRGISGSGIAKQVRMRQFVIFNFYRECEGLPSLTQKQYESHEWRETAAGRVKSIARRNGEIHKQIALYCRADRQTGRELLHYAIASAWQPASAARFVLRGLLSLSGRTLPDSWRPAHDQTGVRTRL
jgi:glycosyltransferase involved in cell wall biosynthesis